jgi:hypothetical protein
MSRRNRIATLFSAPLALCCYLGALGVHAQSPVPAEAAKAATPVPAEPATAASSPLELNSLAWLEGCWRGEVGQYEFREHWLPLRGGLMVGAGHSLMQGKTQDYGYLRLETRPDGVYYVAIPPGKKESSFKLTAAATDDKDTIFTFTNSVDEFPKNILYRRGIDGWLYATVEGKVKGENKKVIYPMRRVDCESGELIRK